jgi:outer membrane lipoprotein-sorting protein
MKAFLILMLSTVLSLHAQESGKDWLKKMNERYAKATSIQLEFEASYFSTHSLGSPSNSMKGKVAYDGDNYYSDAMGQEIIITKKSMLIVDKAEKSITVLPGRDTKDAKNTGASMEPDSAWLAATSITLQNSTGPTRTVIVKEKNSIYERTEITINATTCAMEKVAYYYNAIETGGKPAFVVTYTNVHFDEDIPDSQFSEKKYIQRKGNAISPAAAFSQYAIVDLRDQYEN